MKDRIAQIMQEEGLSNAEFADKIGISTSSLSHIFNGRNKPSLEVVMRIHKAYPHINLNWLLYGEGIMQEEQQEESKKRDIEGISSIDFLSDFPQKTPEITSSSSDACNLGQKNVLHDHSISPKELVREEIKYIEKPHPKITEIRIFFDNGTYEVFKPEK